MKINFLDNIVDDFARFKPRHAVVRRQTVDGLGFGDRARWGHALTRDRRFASWAT